MAIAAPDPAVRRRERLAAGVLSACAASAAAAAGVAAGWRIEHALVVAFLAAIAAVVAKQAIEVAENMHYDAVDPVLVLAAIVGGPLAGALVGAACGTLYANWRSRLGYASGRVLQGVSAGAAAQTLGLGYHTTGRALATALAAEAAGMAFVFAMTCTLDAVGVVNLDRRVVLTNLFDPVVGTPLVAGLALGFGRAGAGLLVLLLVPSLLAAGAVRVVRERWRLRAAESEARARRDALTGAYNRRWFDEALAREVGTGANVGLVLLDLDHFKAVNDAHGHAAGDVVLVESVRRLAARVRPGDGVARWGGEEFAVLLRGVGDGADLERRAEDLRAAIGGNPFRLDGVDVTVTASAGAATVAGDADSLVRAADAALYDAKRAGRNRAVLV
jgi:diguanylate cyclase (GGDEF)-like protein